eukprot:9494147-Pyramimonas_sp.AAC.1
MDDAEEADVRVRALCSIFEGSMIDMATPGGPPGLLPRDDTRVGSYTPDDVRKAILKMPNFKSAPVLKLIDTETDLPDQDTHDGSIIELWKLLATEATPALHG